MPTPTVDTLIGLLGRRIDDREVVSVFGAYLPGVDQSDFTAYCACTDIGVSIAFKRGAGLSAIGEDAQKLLVNGFHLHAGGHENYREYDLPLPVAIMFGDREETIVSKLGSPSTVGGGKFSSTLKKVVPRWIRYANTGKTVLHFQFSASGSLELLTLSIEKV